MTYERARSRRGAPLRSEHHGRRPLPRRCSGGRRDRPAQALCSLRPLGGGALLRRSALTGLPVWSPVFAWMGAFFGGLQVCRWLYAWLGVAFTVASVAMFLQWFRQMTFDATDRGFSVAKYMNSGSVQEEPEVGRYNGGQKFFFWAVGLGALALLLSGTVLWWPTTFPIPLRWVAIILHDIAFIAFFAAIVGHIYLGTAAEPGTFHSMTRGTVTKAWARMHHPRWYREVTGAKSKATVTELGK